MPLLMPHRRTFTLPEDLFFAARYTGNATAGSTLVTGINMAQFGGLAWIKQDATSDHVLISNERGLNRYLATNKQDEQGTDANIITAFGTSTLTIGASAKGNAAGQVFNIWAFRQAAGFFLQQTFTHVNGVATSLNLSPLGVPGFATIKRTDASSDWYAWHRALPEGNNLRLNADDLQSETPAYISVDGTSLTFSADAPSGAYELSAWAHNENLIDCGSYDGNGSTSGPSVVCGSGWRPQFLWNKPISSPSPTTVDHWTIVDTVDGVNEIDITQDSLPTQSITETYVLNGTGFAPYSTFPAFNAAGNKYAYVAIREPSS